MTEPFVKLDSEDVERAFEDLAKSKINNGEFLQTLVQSKLFTMADRPKEGAIGVDQEGVNLLHLPDEQGEGSMLALYTDPEGAKKAKQQAPGFDYLSRVDVIWALLHMEPGVGVMINPGEERTFRIAPEGADQLRETVRNAIEA